MYPAVDEDVEGSNPRRGAIWTCCCGCCGCCCCCCCCPRWAVKMEEFARSLGVADRSESEGAMVPERPRGR